MIDNIEEYLSLKGKFENQVLSNISFINQCEGWVESYSDGRMRLNDSLRILKFECMQNNVLTLDEYNHMSMFLERLFFLEDDSFMSDAIYLRQDEEIHKKLEKAKKDLEEAYQILCSSFVGYYDFSLSYQKRSRFFFA